MKLLRALITHVPTSIVTLTTLWKLDLTYFRIGVLVDLLACPRASVIFEQGAVELYVNSSYRWLIFSRGSLSEPAYLLKNVPFRFDTSITIATPDEDAYALADLYKSTTSEAVFAQPVGRFHVQAGLSDWVDAENAPFRSKVDRTLPTGILVLKADSMDPTDAMERFNLPRGHPRVPATFFGMEEYHVFRALAKLYNISLKMRWQTQSGYADNYGVFTGIVGDLQLHKAEVGASKVLMTPRRLSVIDYLNICEPFSLGVIYYVTQSSDTTTALFRPFSLTLWICVLAVGAIFISTFWLVALWKLETGVFRSSVLLVVVGTFNGQGHPLELRWWSTRSTLFVALLAGFTLASAYSAVIIRSLLSAPVPNIRNREDFLRSPMKMAVEDYYHFTKAVFNEADMDEYTRKIFDHKVDSSKGGGGFRPVPDAFEGMLGKRWAIFAQSNNIQLEMARATPAQICRLAWIRSLQQAGRLCPIISKKSELRDLLNRGYPLANERGIRNREKVQHYATPILCRPEYKRQWAPVKIQIVYPAIGMVLAGTTAGILLCITEWFTSWHTTNTPKFVRLSP